MSRHASPTTLVNRQRLNFVVIAAGVVAAVVLALTFSGTFSAFTQAFLHGSNSVSTQTLSIEETDAAGVSTGCTETNPGRFTCDDTDLYGGQSLKPGDTSDDQTVVFRNVGVVTPARAEISGGPCLVDGSDASSLCDALLVSMTWDGEPVSTEEITPSDLAAGTFSVPVPAAGDSVVLTVSVTLPDDAAQETSGVELTQPLTFTFTA